jgi:hypothetical protein
MRISCSHIGAVLTKKRSFRYIFAYFGEKFLLVFELEQGDLITVLEIL